VLHAQDLDAVSVRVGNEHRVARSCFGCLYADLLKSFQHRRNVLVV
jgi:hypothetical protein